MSNKFPNVFANSVDTQSDTINDSDIGGDISHISGFSSFHFTDEETSGFGMASINNQELMKLPIPLNVNNEGKSDDESSNSKVFSQFLKKSTTPLSPENSLNESTISLAKLEASFTFDDDLDANFLRSQTDEIDRNVTQFLSTSTNKRTEEDIKETDDDLECNSDETLINQTEKDSFILKDVQERFGFKSVNNESSVSMMSAISVDLPFQRRLHQRPSELNRDAERIAGQIMIERPNLDGSSSDGDDDIVVSKVASSDGGSAFFSHNGMVNSLPNNPRVLQELDYISLDTVPERQSAEGEGRGNTLTFVDGGGGGDGSSDHSDDGGGAVRAQRLVPTIEHTVAEAERITPPNRERPVGGSGNNIENIYVNMKQVQFQSPINGSMNSSAPNQSNEKLTVTLTDQNVDFDETPCEDQESRLSSRYFLAASTPFLGATTLSDHSPDFESNTMRLQDFEADGSIFSQTLTNDVPKSQYKDISEWAKQGEMPDTSLFGEAVDGISEDFQVMNQDFEGMLEEDEKLVAESNDTIVKDVNDTGISEWSVRTDNVQINPDLLPSVNSTNSDGNVSRYFKYKSHELGKSIGKVGSRPKFSDATLSITSPEKGSPVKLMDETVRNDSASNVVNGETFVNKKDNTIKSSNNGVSRNPDAVFDKGTRSRSSITSRKNNTKSETRRNNSKGSVSDEQTLPYHKLKSVNNDSFSIPVCKQEAGALFDNIQERRISIVGIEKSQMENLAKIIASLTGSDAKMVYKVMQIMSNENTPSLMTSNVCNKDDFSHKSIPRQSNTAPHVMSGPMTTSCNLFSEIPNTATQSFMENIQPTENLYHTLHPSIDRDSCSRFPSTVNSNTNTYKLAAVTPYQMSNSHASPVSLRQDYLRSSENRPENMYVPNDSFYTSAGSLHSSSRQQINLNDTISYSPNINFGFCCIGEKTTKIFKMYNSNSCWVQLHFNIVFFAYNGCENSDNHTEPFIINPTKVVVGPNSSEEVKVKFLPKQTGSFTMKVELLAGTLIDGGDNSVNWPKLPKLLSIEGICELPELEVILGENKCIDFGEIPYGTCDSRELHIINKGKADIPVKLSISSSHSAVGFSFESSSSVMVDNSCRPPMATTIVKGREDGLPIRPSIIVIKYNAPRRPQDHQNQSQTSPVEHSCQLDIKTDTEQILPISRLLMKAIVGFLRLHSLRTLQPICLSCMEGAQCKEMIPLRNAGNLTLNLSVKLCGTSPFFSISPPYLKLLPGEESDVKVLFTPDVPAYVESIVKVSILPNGDEYEWILKGKSSKLIPTNKPMLLCNTHALNWSGVQIGRSQQQKLILCNSSDDTGLHLSLSIAGDHANFQIVNDVTLNHKDLNKFETVINPKGELPVHILFLPSYLRMANSSLIIRTLDGHNKYEIPLSGYGGKSQLDISGANNLHDQFWIDMDEVYLGKKNIMNIMLRNNGSRAAFISIKCFADITARLEYPVSHVCITPNNFVLKEKVSTQITLTYQPLQDHAKKLQEGNYTSAHLVIYSGDEVMRKAYRKQVNGIHGNPVLKSLDTPFANEEYVNEDISYAMVTDWNSFLHRCIDKNVIALVARHAVEKSEEPSPDAMQKMMTHITPAQKLKTSIGVQLSGVWSVSPEKVVLNTSEGSTCKLKMVNYSNKVISFEFIWPGQTLVITPSKDKIPPRSQFIIKVSAKTSFLSNAEDLPWSGNIYIQCNGEQKGVEVEICNTAVSEQSPMLPSNDMVEISPNDVSIIPHLSTSKEKFGEKHITVSPPVLEFAKTKVGSPAQSYVTITNRVNEACMWRLVSLAPPYCKSVDGKSGIIRVTYTAFRFAIASGTLGGLQSTKLSVSFSPRSEGMYSQFWEIEASNEGNSIPTKTRLEVNGQGHIEKCVKDDSTGDGVIPDVGRRSTDKVEKKRNSVDKDQLVFVKDSLVTFPQTNVGDKISMFFRLCNRSEKIQKVKLTGLKPPFTIDHMTLTLRAKNYVRVPLHFSPQVANAVSHGAVNVVREDDSIITVQMVGKSG